MAAYNSSYLAITFLFFMPNVIGRSEELELLDGILNAKDAQLVALYGRRRIGKTYLIREFFQDKGVYFEVTGLKDATMSQQLENFTENFSKNFFNHLPLQVPKNWKKAFHLLTKQIKERATQQKVIVFLDELPWLATKRSMLMQTLDYFWNTEWSLIPNLRLILCGSAASWMLDNLINAKGGLHNRISKTILLKPFNLKQTKQFLNELKIKLSNKQVLDLYLVMGGVPYYLKQIQKNKSVAENINNLCFTEDGLLNREFPRLFHALFDQAETNLRLIRIIASQRYGVSRDFITKKLGMKSGGTLTNRLDELEAAGFIKHYIPYGYVGRESFYRIIDEYSLFYLKWIEPTNLSGLGFKPEYWHTVMNSTSYMSWAGYAFESICLKHVYQILKALKLTIISSRIGSWRYIPKKSNASSGAQIDLIIDREDDAITLCEIKFTNKLYVMDKAEAKVLANKMEVFLEQTKTGKQLFLAMVTTQGVKKNLWSEDLMTSQVILDDLFQ